MNKVKLKRSTTAVSPNASACHAVQDAQFELELCWCVQQLENSVNSGKLSRKIAEDTIKNIKILKSDTAPVIKKRQLMRAVFGDYRSKMREEEKRMALASNQIVFASAAEVCKKSSFVKKAAILTSGKDFRFNFNLEDKANTCESDLTRDNEIDGEVSTPSFCNITHIKSAEAGDEFRFNFVIEESTHELELNNLSINS